MSCTTLMYISWVLGGGSAPPVMLRLMLNSEREILAPSEVTVDNLANRVSKCMRPDLGIGVEADRGAGLQSNVPAEEAFTIEL